MHIQKISKQMKLAPSQVKAVANLLEQNSTIPFIARYRKEVTGSLDEILIRTIRDLLRQLQELDARKKTVIKSLEEHGHLTDKLKAKVEKAETITILEDIYLPYKPKRRTRGTIAREKGLSPLAELIFAQKGVNPDDAALNFINPEKEIKTREDALSGARDIIAEIINEDQKTRELLRRLFETKGVIFSSLVPGMEKEGVKYKDYFQLKEPATIAPSHRILAIRRGEKEKVLKFRIFPEETKALNILENNFIKGSGKDSLQVRLAIHDSYKRLLLNSMETEIKTALKTRADSEATKVFTQNLQELLMASPLGAKRIIAIDPGYRTGCKIVCLDKQGKLLHHDIIYPNISEEKTSLAVKTIKKLCDQFKIEAIGVGNGTGGRETELFLKDMGLSEKIQVISVNESGASIYSASKTAREEFPDLDLTVRGAISIGRRLMDPLSELVKIDPKSIGVGQYQHDVDQADLKKSLDDTVISCVNSVGVDANQASASLFSYVSGIGPGLAKKIVKYRDKNGPFKNRRELLNVPGLGPRAFEQAAGFLRIRNGNIPLDAGAVHPESYHIVDMMAKDQKTTVEQIIKSDSMGKKIDISKYVSAKIGLPTLNDIMEELARPGRDPRKIFETFNFAKNINKPEDLKPGMRIPGIITNVTSFGAFIDIGVHQDGLAHISELSDGFVKDPSKIVKVNQKVNVTVLNIDLERNRISLSLKNAEAKPMALKKIKP